MRMPTILRATNPGSTRGPARCIRIGDRGTDIYELFCAASQAGTHFVFQTCVDRCAGAGDHTVQDEMQEGCAEANARLGAMTGSLFLYNDIFLIAMMGPSSGFDRRHVHKTSAGSANECVATLRASR